jgi:phospholipid-binding lipoprotein MlaA
LRIIAPASVLVLTACSVPDGSTDVHDPYESVNRYTHSLNVGLDRVALRPASRAYGAVVPPRFREGLDNAANNLGAPSDVANYVLQGDLDNATIMAVRFFLNSTIGVLGFFDPATSVGLVRRQTGFGETLAVWGAPEGAYQVLPLLGPSTERDTAGRIVDIVTNPIGTMFGSDAEEADAALTVTGTLNYRYNFSDTVDGILYDSADSYSQLRLFYLDSRRFGLGTGDTSAESDPYEDLYEGLYDE